MQKYKIKLQAGDYLPTGGLSEKDYYEIGNRFMEDGCPKLEFPRVDGHGGFIDQDFFGWSKRWGGFYHAASEAFDGRILRYSEVMELAEPEASTDWHERGELPPVGTRCEWSANERCFEPCTILIYHAGCVVFYHTKYPANVRLLKLEGITFRPIKSDRQKAIEKALEYLPFGDATNEYSIKCLGIIYDAGLLKLPEEK